MRASNSSIPPSAECSIALRFGATYCASSEYIRPRSSTGFFSSIAISEAGGELIRRCDPNRTVGYRILVHVERLKDGHGLVALLAVPERPHIVSTFPLRDRISRIGIILVPKEPLPLQPPHITTNFQRFLESGLE